MRFCIGRSFILSYPTWCLLHRSGPTRAPRKLAFHESRGWDKILKWKYFNCFKIPTVLLAASSIFSSAVSLSRPILDYVFVSQLVMASVTTDGQIVADRLIVVCCHAIWLGGPTSGHNADECKHSTKQALSGSCSSKLRGILLTPIHGYIFCTFMLILKKKQALT